MKLLSYNFKDAKELDTCLARFRMECPETAASVVCMLITSQDDPEAIRRMTRRIRTVLPEVGVCGTTTSGEIGDAKFHRYTHELCFYVFESRSSVVETAFYDGHSTDLLQAVDEVVQRATAEKPVALGILVTLKTLDGATELLERFQALPSEIPVFGGASDSYREKSAYYNETPTYVFAGDSCTNKGFLVFLLYGEDLHVHVDSYLGWRPLGKEAVVTRMDGDTHVLTLNHEPIADFYERYIGMSRGPKFFSSVMPFPLLLKRSGQEVARFTTGCDADGSMYFSSGIRVGERVRLSYGDPGDMLEHAHMAQEKLRSFSPQGILLIPCLIRNMYLRDDFGVELARYGAIAPTVGYLSYGEMQRFEGSDEVQLLNGAMLIVAFREGPASEMSELSMEDIEEEEFSDDRIALARGLAHFVSVTNRELEQNQALMLRERERREEEEAARKAAILASQAKTDFLFNMSHDIRTPMNAIIGFTNLLREHMDNRVLAGHYLDKIQSSNEFLLSLVNNVLEMARIESGKMTLDEAYADIEELGKEITSVFENEMKEKGITFRSTMAVKHKTIFADMTKVREIMLNLLSNALKYTPEGGSVSTEVRELPSERPGYGLYQARISDTGVGMPKEFLPHIYDAFSREKNTTQSGIQGTGLGMVIVKKLVSLLGGTIEVESELGKGTTFVVTLPHRLAEERKGPSQDVQEKRSYEHFKGMQLLLAEDNELNAEIAVMLLQDRGFLVDHAIDGVECVDMLEKAEDGFYDLILMDVQMPRLDGYKATMAIRGLKDKKKAGIPVIAMTANAFDEDKKRALLAGMNAHVPKPFDVDVLFDTIYNVLKYKERYIHSDEVAKFKEKHRALGHPCGYFAYRADWDEEILYADQAAAEIFGCATPEEFMEQVGGSFKTLVHESYIDSIEEEIERQQSASDNNVDYVEYDIIRKDGELRRVADIGYKIFDGEQMVYYVYIADITKE